MVKCVNPHLGHLQAHILNKISSMLNLCKIWAWRWPWIWNKTSPSYNPKTY